MSEWSVPAGMTPQDNPGQPKPGVAEYVKLIRDNATEMRDKLNNLLKQSGIKAVVGGLRVLGFLQSDNFDGDLDAGNPGTTGWAMNASRVAIGELFLRPGSLGNDTLTSPVVYDGTFVNEFNFGLTTTHTQRATCTFVVPAGFTNMSFTMLGDMLVGNSTASAQHIYVQSFLLLDGVEYNGASSIATLPAGFWGTILAPYIYQDDVVPGSTITFYTKVWASANIAADVAHRTSSIVAITLTR